jgi:hypothetical protein
LACPPPPLFTWQYLLHLRLGQTPCVPAHYLSYVYFLKKRIYITHREDNLGMRVFPQESAAIVSLLKALSPCQGCFLACAVQAFVKASDVDPLIFYTCELVILLPSPPPFHSTSIPIPT